MCVCWSLTVLTKHAHVHLHKFQISFKSMTEQRKPTLPLWCRKSIFIIFHWLAVYVLSNLQTRSKSVSVHSSVQENSWPAATAYLFVCVCFKCHGVRPWHTRCWQWSSVFGSLYLAEEPPDMVRVMCTNVSGWSQPNWNSTKAQNTGTQCAELNRGTNRTGCLPIQTWGRLNIETWKINSRAIRIVFLLSLINLNQLWLILVLTVLTCS